MKAHQRGALSVLSQPAAYYPDAEETIEAEQNNRYGATISGCHFDRGRLPGHRGVSPMAYLQVVLYDVSCQTLLDTTKHDKREALRIKAI